ncbi:MAG: hypothetical protein ACKVVP_24885 [Chloroflexota bacterium]
MRRVVETERCLLGGRRLVNGSTNVEPGDRECDGGECNDLRLLKPQEQDYFLPKEAQTKSNEPLPQAQVWNTRPGLRTWPRMSATHIKSTATPAISYSR